MRVYLFPILLFVVAACTTGTSDLSEEHRAALADSLRQMGHDFADTWNAGDPEAYLALFSEDVVFFYEGARLDRSGVEAAVRDYWASHSQADYRFENLYVAVLGPDAAIVGGTFEFTETDTTGAQATGSGALSLVYTRSAEGWRVRHAHESVPTESGP